MNQFYFIRSKLIGLTVTMFLAVLLTSGVGGFILYQTSISETAQRLTETAKSNARMIEAVTLHNIKYAERVYSETSRLNFLLNPIRAAHEQFRFGHSGEFTLARKEGDQIVFLMRNYLAGSDIPKPVSFYSTDQAEPMRRAISGQSGWVIGSDYRNINVMAAYEPIKYLNLGLVVKIDIQEVRAPFIKAGLIIFSLAILISLGALQYFSRTSRQIHDKFEDSSKQFTRLATNAKDMIYRMSLPEGRYEYVNPASTELFGVTPEEFYESPKKILELIHPEFHSYFKDEWQKLLAGDMPPSYEYQIVTPSSEVKWINQRNVLVSDEKGHPVAIEGIVTDITENKRFEEKLVESEARLKKSQDIGNIGCWEYDLFSGKIWGSDESFHIYGMIPPPNSDLPIDQVEACIPEHERVHQALLDLIEIGKSYNLEFAINPLDGSSQRFIRSKAELILDDKGNTIKVAGVIQDITEQKKAQEELIESERRLSILIGNLSGMAYRCQNQFPRKIIFISESCLSLTGFSSQELMTGDIGTFASLIMLEDMPHVMQTVEQAINQNRPYEVSYRIMRKDGDIRWVWERGKYVAKTIDGPNMLEGMIDDITEQKLTKMALENSEESLRLSTEMADIAVWDFDVIANQTNRSDNHDRLYGLERQEVWNTEKFLQVIHPEDKDVSQQKVYNVLKPGGVDNTHFDFRTIWPDETLHWLAITAEVSKRDKSGAATYVRGALMDITKRKQAEEELRTSEERLREAQHIAHIAHWKFDPQKGMPWWSEELYRIYGRDPANGPLLYAEHQKFVHPDDWEWFDATVQATVKDGKPFDIILRIIRPDGNERIINSICQPIKDERGTVVEMRGTIQDVTKLKQVEAKLKNTNDNLEKIVEERTRQLAEAQQQAEAANQAKSFFLASMSHEIRKKKLTVGGIYTLMRLTNYYMANIGIYQGRDNLNRIFPSAIWSMAPNGSVVATVDKLYEYDTGIELYTIPGASLSGLGYLYTKAQAFTSNFIHFIYFNSSNRTLNVVNLVDEIGLDLMGQSLNPQDGAVVNTPDILTWAPISGIEQYDLYLGTDYDDIAAADHTSPFYLGRVTGTNFALLQTLSSVKHFWRIDPVTPYGPEAGEVYTFTVSDISLDAAKIKAHTISAQSDYQVNLQLTSEEPESWDVTAADSWITFTESSGTTPSTLSVHLDATMLTTGVHNSLITLNCDSGPLQIPVRLEVEPLNITHIRSDRHSTKAYAISEDTGINSQAYLLEIDSAVEKIQRVIPVGTSVTDFTIHSPDDLIYVTNWKSGNLLSIDKTTFEHIESIAFQAVGETGYSQGDIYRVAAGVSGRLVVEEENQWIDISIFNTNTETTLSEASVREGGGAFDPTGRYYYHGESNSSGASIIKFDTSGDTFTQLEKVRPPEISSYNGSMTVNDYSSPWSNIVISPKDMTNLPPGVLYLLLN